MAKGPLSARFHDWALEPPQAGAVGYVEGVCVEMVRNPNESLMLEALLVRLSAVTG